ncbi:hypothetical protein Csa_000098, partial [Cucumis sativus]
MGQNAHVSITQFANVYGPLISLKLGAQRLIVASSRAATTAVLRTQDCLLSARYIFQMTPDRALHDQHSLVFSHEYGDQWKNLRSICKVNLFTAKEIESQDTLREKKMKELVEFLESKQGSVVEIKDFVFTSVFKSLTNLIQNQELLSAGTDTTTTTVEWTMSEILKDKDILNKAREEIKKVAKESPAIDESNISKLQYLWSCVKETLRLHPPAPFLLPRLAPMDCEVTGYSIPKDSMIFANVWGIGRDPSIWEDSQTFNPQRFDVGCGNNVDFKGYDYRYLPFGGGRRICPGLPIAIVQ